VRVSSLALWARLEGLWGRVLRMSRRPAKTLRLCESLPLGERRFVAVVEVEKERFLVGGTANSLVLLSRLPSLGGNEGCMGSGDEES
jgi:flagellar biogenesis protein FliO